MRCSFQQLPTFGAASLIILTAGSGCRNVPEPGPAPRAQKDGGLATDEDEGEARFHGRQQNGKEAPVTLQSIAVHAWTGTATVRTRLALELATTAEGQVEALMRLPVPPGAAVVGAALWVDGRPVAGTLTARERATEIYRGIVERRRDPALITWGGPGWISVSVFPVEARNPRRLELEWVEPAAVREGLVHVRVPTVSERRRVLGRPGSITVDGRPLPVRDQGVLPVAHASDIPSVTARAPGDPFHQILIPGGQPASPPKLVLVAETSASLDAADRQRQRDALTTVIRGLPATARVSLMSADWRSKVLADAVSPDKLEAALDRLDATPSAGALDIERMLQEAAEHARAAAASAIVFAGIGDDGFLGDALGEPIRRLRQDGVRLQVVTLGRRPTGALLDAAALTGGEALSPGWLDTALPRIVASACPRPPRPTVMPRGLDTWYPLETIFGDTVWLGRALDVTEQKSEAGARPALRGDPHALLALWDRARLGHDPLGRGAHEQDVGAAVAPLQALLVLEDANAYAANGLRAPEPWRSADAPVAEARLTKDQAAAAARNAGVMGILKAGEAPSSVFGRDSALGNDAQNVLGGLIGNQIGEAYGVGGLGLTGTGSGGGGTGEETIGFGTLGTIGKEGGRGHASGYARSGIGGRRAKAPDVIPGTPSIRGALDTEIVRRIIRRHISEVRYCYEQELTRNPDLVGRIVTQFTIGSSGQVIASVLQSSTMQNARVENCVVQAVRRWEFPKPLGGGIVIVSYPFVLTPPGATARAEMRGPAVAAPPDAVQRSLAILNEKADLTDRVQRIAAELRLAPTADPERVAWILDRRGATLDRLLLIARLLQAADRQADACRILSERAVTDHGAIAAEYRRTGARSDADRVIELHDRPSRR